MKTPEWQAARPRSIERWAWLAFALCLFAGLGTGLVWYLRVSHEYMTYQLHTEDAVSGLMVDAPVEFHGVEVGRVAKVALDGPRSVNIVLKIRNGTPVGPKTVATITARGLAARGFMGYVYVALDDDASRPGTQGFDPVSHLPLIAVGPSRSDTLDTTIYDVAANVQALRSLAQSVLNQDTLAELDASLRNLESVSRTLAANSDRLNSVLANAERVSRQAGPLLETGNSTLRAMQTQVLPEAYKTLAQMDALSKSMTNLTDQLTRNPSILIRGSTGLPPGPGERDGRR